MNELEFYKEAYLRFRSLTEMMEHACYINCGGAMAPIWLEAIERSRQWVDDNDEEFQEHIREINNKKDKQ